MNLLKISNIMSSKYFYANIQNITQKVELNTCYRNVRQSSFLYIEVLWHSLNNHLSGIVQLNFLDHAGINIL